MKPTIEELCLQAVNAGFRVTPVYASGKTKPYANGESYPYREHPKLWQKAVAVGAVLDSRLLLDWDNNKPSVSAPSLEELENKIEVELPPPFQSNSVGTSLHFLFRIPKDVSRETLFQSQDGQFMEGIDLKTGNQLIHIKPEASDGSKKTQHWSVIPTMGDAPQTLVEAMTKKSLQLPTAPYKPFRGNNLPEAESQFHEEVKHFASLAEGQDGGRNNALYKLVCKWLAFAFSGDIDPQYVEAKVRAAARLNKCEGVEATIESAKAIAKNRPRRYLAKISPPTNINQTTHSTSLKNSNLSELADFEVIDQQRFIGEDLRDALILLQNTFCNRLRTHNEAFYWWTGRNWNPASELLIRQKIGHAFVISDQRGMQKRIKTTLSAMRDHAQIMPELDPPLPFIFFLNGALHVPSNTLTPHTPEHLNTFILSVEYNPDAKCPTWTSWLKTIFKEEPARIKHLEEALGWLLTRSNFGIEKAILLLGPPRAGKGVICRIIEQVLGQGATAFRLAELDDNKALSSMRRRNVAIDHDVAKISAKNEELVCSLFKRITSNDRVNIPLLYKQAPWEGALNCKLLIAANSSPMMKDDSPASVARWMPVKFDLSFSGKEDPELISALITEITGITYNLCQALQRLVSRGRFAPPNCSLDILDSMAMDSEGVWSFIQDCLLIGKPYRASDAEIWDRYRSWASDNNLTPKPRKFFIKSVEDALQGQARRSKSVTLNSGKTVRGFYELSVKPSTMPDKVKTLRPQNNRDTNA